MDADTKLQNLYKFVNFLAGFLIGTIITTAISEIGFRSSVNTTQKQAILNGFARYNPTNATFEWVNSGNNNR